MEESSIFYVIVLHVTMFVCDKLLWLQSFTFIYVYNLLKPLHIMILSGQSLL